MVTDEFKSEMKKVTDEYAEFYRSSGFKDEFLNDIREVTLFYCSHTKLLQMTC